jgi:hypothetical protein
VTDILVIPAADGAGWEAVHAPTGYVLAEARARAAAGRGRLTVGGSTDEEFAI